MTTLSLAQLKPKRIRIWLNNEKDCRKLLFDPRELKSWHLVLNYVTQEFKPAFGPIQKIISLETLQPVTCYEELDPDVKYVAISYNQKFKNDKLLYRTSSEREYAKLRPKKRHYIGEFDSKILPFLKVTMKHNLTLVYMVVNGKMDGPFKVVFKESELQNWKLIKNYVTKVLGINNGVQNIFTIFGEPLHDAKELQHGCLYVAVPFFEKFKECASLSVLSFKKNQTDSLDRKKVMEHVRTPGSPCIMVCDWLKNHPICIQNKMFAIAMDYMSLFGKENQSKLKPSPPENSSKKNPKKRSPSCSFPNRKALSISRVFESDCDLYRNGEFKDSLEKVETVPDPLNTIQVYSDNYSLIGPSKRSTSDRTSKRGTSKKSLPNGIILLEKKPKDDLPLLNRRVEILSKTVKKYKKKLTKLKEIAELKKQELEELLVAMGNSNKAYTELKAKMIQTCMWLTVPLENLRPEQKGPVPTTELTEWFDDLWSRGQILLGLCYNTKKRALVVSVVRCVNLLPMDNNGLSDPFVKLQLKPDPNHKKHKTSIKWKNLNPVFNEEFAFETRPTELSTQSLYITVYDKDYGKSNDYLGGLILGGSGSKGLRLKHWMDMIRYPDHRHEQWHNLTEDVLG